MKGLVLGKVLGGDSATADFTGDGIPDIILTMCEHVPEGSTVSGATPSRFMLLKGKGDGSFVDGSPLMSGGGKITPGCVRHLQVGDFNSDGTPDFVTASNYEDGRVIFDPNAVAAP